MSQLPRRRFLTSAVSGATALSIGVSLGAKAGAAKAFRPLGANDDIRIGVAGVRGRGNGLMQSFHAAAGARVVALCDPDEGVLASRAKWFADRNEPVATYLDVRKMLDQDDIDVLVVATPNHWHSLMTIWGCQAGKDVYCEKPVSHNVFEGRKAAEAVTRYKRVVATGTQSRSSKGIREAIAWIHSGALGKVLVSRGLCYKSRPSIGKVSGPQPLPKGLDYNLWCGPADMEPLRRRQLHYDWHWVWATGNGDIGNQGIHQMDIARWALGVNHLSKRVVSIGGRFGYVDDGETPNTQAAFHEYDEGLLVFEVRGLYENNGNAEKEGYRKIKIGNVVECENGYVAIDTSRAWAYDNSGELIKKFEPGGNTVKMHIDNFLAAVRSRRNEDLVADFYQGHLSSALCHTGNISHRVGYLTPSEEVQKSFATESFADETYARFREHLSEKGVDLTQVKPVLGQPLNMDPYSETFQGHPTASLLLSRNYRAPFVVPDRV